jgi:hypothetical protein
MSNQPPPGQNPFGNPQTPSGHNPQKPPDYNPYQSPQHQQMPQGPRLGDDPALRMLLPVGRSFWAIAAGYAGLFAVLCLPAPLALLLGIIAVIDIRRNPHKHGMGRAIFGIVMGGIFSLLLVVVFIAAASSGFR